MSSSRRNRVAWDEDNLAENEEYRRTHPVTMHIDEPKTPFIHVDDDVEEDVEERSHCYWDADINAYAKEVKDRVLHDTTDAPKAPVRKGRPMLADGTVTGDLERDKHDRDFKKMRRAVYADEGKKFKNLLSKGNADVEDN
ncbi:hypothetical protein STCU_04693 [Strigomonas culicis]|uniref:Protein phosphatase inhibitor 2 (IPP-2) n=1 Tax=Strigomonas culicis TaxID=28005 RepID=S9UK68_9TRYP|nr:hypothetical protein STCU_04693 [Strigomonas culicis]|eukprot:EPY29164.1 hypothetical protein STCU_04693 [Strigomonas culicis]